MYGEYLREKTGDQIMETDRGFATFRYVDDAVYIVDLYIKPDFRQLGEASVIADAICDLARKKGLKKLLGSVVPSAKGSTASMKVLLAYGMKLQSSINDFIIMEKEI